LRLAFEIVEQEDAGIFGKMQPGRNLRKLGLVEFSLVLDFFVDRGGLGDGGPGSAVFLVLFGGRPVDQRAGDLFPLVAFTSYFVTAW